MIVDFFLSITIWHILSFCMGCVIGWITKIPFMLSVYKEIKETDEYKQRRSDAYVEEIQRVKDQYRNLRHD